MKNGAIVQRHAVFFGVRNGAGPVFRAAGQGNKILNSNRRDLRKQCAVHVASRSVNDGRGLAAGGCGRSGLVDGRLGRWLYSRIALCSAEEGSGCYQDKHRQ